MCVCVCVLQVRGNRFDVARALLPEMNEEEGVGVGGGVGCTAACTDGTVH